MTSKRRENINLVSFICFSFLMMLLSCKLLRIYIRKAVRFLSKHNLVPRSLVEGEI